MIDHDQLFKELLTACFADFLDLFLPELGKDLDEASITFLDKELFTDIARGESLEPDLVARARLRGQESFFLIHLEHQAQPQSAFALRMFTYFIALFLKFRIPIYPIAIFSHSSSRPEPDDFAVEFPGFQVLKFQFRAIQLSRLRWRDFVRKPNPVASALMSKMGMRPEERPRVKLECLRLLSTLKLDPARMRLISGFIDAYLQLTTQEALQFHKQADTVLKGTQKNKVMELTTSWKEEGRLEGRQEGRHEEAVQMVLRLLNRRCALPAKVERQVRKLPLGQLENLGEALLDFSSLADLQNWLRASALPRK